MSYLLTQINIHLIFIFKIQLICHVTHFDCAMCHNLRPSEMKVYNGWPKSMFEFVFEFHPKFFIMSHGGFWYYQMTPSQVVRI